MAPYPPSDVLDEHYGAMYPAYEADHGMQSGFGDLVAQARQSGEFRYVKIKAGMRILDVGCGGGAFLRVAQAIGADVMGVEPSENGVKTCKASGVPVFHGELTQYLESNPEPFDLITSNHVVEHHPDPVRFLGEMRSALRKDGTIWISVPNAGSFFARVLKDDWHSADLPVHLQQFTRSSIRVAFERAGLQVNDISTSSENSLPQSLSKMMRKYLFIPRRFTARIFGRLLNKKGVLGRYLDTVGQGDAIFVESRISGG